MPLAIVWPFSVCVCPFLYMSIHTHTYLISDLYKCMYRYVYISIYACVYTCLYIDIHIRICIHISTYIHIYMYICIYIYIVGLCRTVVTVPSPSWASPLMPLSFSYCLGRLSSLSRRLCSGTSWILLIPQRSLGKQGGGLPNTAHSGLLWPCCEPTTS